MMRGLHKINGAIQSEMAWRDWYALERFAFEEGWDALSDKFHPPPKAGYRVVDKCLAQLREELISRGYDPPQNPSIGNMPSTQTAEERPTTD